ncbi:hypothetical protein HZF08_03365 [Paenibacillus sp. CGMCC 1.16610]|uniref:ParB/Sulfiredoxin domain-containing protein n=1 Tax=Paenibacillus anseongense TaxID=2682845 RepID=A0ABW9UEV5_9BACL|nr:MULTISPECIES: hypothetical protein [Paenibacillus]MBA2937332.1 hypothetical protein [Paenibacillus sp. CGMCC 1.16610]MVQ36390.1 hypothetical protein [Paenibacillus anseongense]
MFHHTKKTSNNHSTNESVSIQRNKVPTNAILQMQRTIGNKATMNLLKSYTPQIQRFPEKKGDSNDEYIDKQYPGVTFIKTSGKWNEYMLNDGTIVYYDEGKYWKDANTSQIMDLSGYMNQQLIENAGGKSYNYLASNLTGRLMNIMDLYRAITNHREKLDIPRYDAAKAEMERGEIVYPIEVYNIGDGKLRLSQGNHRLWAAREMGYEVVPVNFL